MHLHRHTCAHRTASTQAPTDAQMPTSAHTHMLAYMHKHTHTHKITPVSRISPPAYTIEAIVEQSVPLQGLLLVCDALRYHMHTDVDMRAYTHALT